MKCIGDGGTCSTGGHGSAFHAGKQTWQEKYGDEMALLGMVNKLLEDL